MHTLRLILVENVLLIGMVTIASADDFEGIFLQASEGG